MSPQYLLVFACLWGTACAHPSTGNLVSTIRATQSSLSSFLGAAPHAIDGNEMGSCSQTRVEDSPWWRVDMHYHYRVYIVEITTSKEGGALNGAKIHIGDCLKNNGTANKVCAEIECIPAGQTRIFRCSNLGVHGRYLTVSIPNKRVALTLCEVKAFGSHEPHHEEDHVHII
ncbi:fucolectin-1-like [Mustelus asterias]